MSHGRTKRLLVQLWRAARNFDADNCLHEAATVSFYSLLSLAPALYVAGAVLGWVFGESVVQNGLSAISPLLPSAAQPTLTQQLGEEVERGEGLILLALPALIWVASSGFYTFELAINVAFATANQRSSWRSRARAFVVLGCGVLFLGAMLLANALLPHFESLRYVLGMSTSSWVLGAGWAHAALMAATFTTFLLAYRMLPRHKARWSAAVAGGLLSLVLWEVVRQVFGWMLARSPSFGLWSGTLASSVAFLLWIYVSVAVTLYGAEFAAIRDGRRGELRSAPVA